MLHEFLSIAGALALLSIGCGEQLDLNLVPNSDLVVGRDAVGRIEIRWSGAPATGRYRVYTGSSPDSIDRSTLLAELRGDSATKSVTISGVDRVTRHYFELVETSTGESRIVAERLLPVEGANNFRDLGGYATRDGRRVRWGLLYRSDHLADLSERGLRYLEHLGVRLLCDFRGPGEREEDPNRLPAENGPRTVELSIADESFDPDELRRRILSGDLADVALDQILVEGNRKFATVYRDRYRTLFELLKHAGNLPLLIHCTAGKDRTGFAAALILFALGVPEETVFRDFLLSNVYRADHTEKTLTALRYLSLFRTDPEDVRPLLEVRREYLQAAFDAIRSEYASLDHYLRDGLGLSDTERVALKARLLR